MPANIMTTDATAATADLVVTSPITVGLKGVVPGTLPRVVILLKDDTNNYNETDVVLTASYSSTMIVGPGTYRFARVAGVACGVYSA